MAQISAVIYDMDGVIIDSEPLWRRAEIICFATVGISLTEQMCMQTMGLRLDEVVGYWFEKFSKDKLLAKQVENLIWKEIIELVSKEGQAKEGVYESLDFIKNKGIKLALASSSAMVLINTVLDKLSIRNYFSVIHSAEFERKGKPDPAIYLNTAKKMHVPAEACVAIEDSANGVKAAKAAKMKCIAIPEESTKTDKRILSADIMLSSLKELNQNIWESL